MSSLHLISRYAGGADESAPLHKLGGEARSKARQKAAEKVRDVAAQLLDIYAQRAVKPALPLNMIANSTASFASLSRLKPLRIRSRLLMPC